MVVILMGVSGSGKSTVGRLLAAGLYWLPDGRTLFVTTSETDDPVQARERKSGRIECVDLDVAGAG